MPFWKRKSVSKQDSQPSQSTWQATVPARSGAAPSTATAAAANPFRRRGDEFFNEADYSNAVFMYCEALRQPQDELSKEQILLQLAIARTMCSPPDLNGALTNVITAMQINPTNGQAWRVIGDIHERQNDHKSAEEALVQATALLSGYEKVQATQALANVRLQIASGTAPQNPQSISISHSVQQTSFPSISVTSPQPSVPPVSTQAGLHVPSQRNLHRQAESASLPLGQSSTAGSSCAWQLLDGFRLNTSC